MALIENRFDGNGLYFLDEPEAALSPSRQMTLLAMLHQFVCQGAQCVIATHSPILMAYPNAPILQFDDDGIHPVTYENTEHFQVTREFMNRYPSMLKILMAGDGDTQGDS
jgi:predicted ATPase